MRNVIFTRNSEPVFMHGCQICVPNTTACIKETVASLDHCYDGGKLEAHELDEYGRIVCSVEIKRELIVWH